MVVCGNAWACEECITKCVELLGREKSCHKEEQREVRPWEDDND
jgi:hypothetical protein